MTVFELLRNIKDDLFIAQNYNLTKEQLEHFRFIEERLLAGWEAEKALLEIEIICGKAEGKI